MEDFINFWVNGVCTCVVVFCGIFLNSVSIYVIGKKYEKSNIFYQMLLRLLCIDICVLVTWFNLSLYLAFKLQNKIIVEMFPYLSYPLTHIAISASTFMTIAIAHERYMAVKYPLKFAEDMKIPSVVKRRLRVYMLIVIMVSVTLNLTYFLELQVNYVTFSTNNTNMDLYDKDNVTAAFTNNITKYTNETSFEFNYTKIETEMTIGYTEFGKHPYYLFYYKIYVRLIVSGIVPFSLLIYFNSSIYNAIMKNNRLRRRLTLSQPLSRVVSVQSGTESTTTTSGLLVTTNRTDEDSLSMAFVAIVSVFLFCNVLKFALNFYDGICGEVGASGWSRIGGYFSNLLIVLNSSMNMVIYCIMNSKFKRHLMATIKKLLPSMKRYNDPVNI